MKNLKKILLTLALLTLSLTAAANTQRGDVNSDGKVNMDDLTSMINYLVMNDMTGVSLEGADVDHNGFIGMDDLTLMIHYLVMNTWGDEPLVHTEVITVNGVSFTMVYVEAGTFAMGATDEQLDDALPDEYPAHKVTLTFDYYIAQTEVTRELWLAVMGELPDRTINGELQRPVTNVNRFDCALFVDYLSQMTGRIFRMPTEAEWEYAARGGKFSRGYKYAGSDDAAEVAWYTSGPGAGLHPVAQKAANELGLYDMSGNASEWCQDWYVLYDSEPQTNPIGPESGQSNVHRGGGYLQPASMCRVAARNRLIPDKCADDLGLRIVMNP